MKLTKYSLYGLVLAISSIPFVAGAGLSSILAPVTEEEIMAYNEKIKPTKTVKSVEPLEAVPAAEVSKPVVPAAKVVEMKKPNYYLEENALVPVLAQLIHDRLELKGELRLSLMRSWEALELPSINWQAKILEVPDAGLAKNMLIRFEVIEGNITVGQWQLPVRCELWRDVLVSTRRLLSGQELLTSDFQRKNIDVLRLREEPVPVAIKIEEYESTQTLSAGRALVWNQIRTKPLIRKGQLVEVVASEGAMHITMKGQALENGALNDFIEIRNLTSKKSVAAQIVDENHVRVHF